MTAIPYTFRVKKVPNPIEKMPMASITAVLLTRMCLLPATYYLVMEGFDFKTYFVITEFKVSIVQKGEDTILDIPVEGNQIPDKIRNIINGLHMGDKVYFEFIKAKMTTGTDSSIRYLGALSFTIN